MSSMIDFVNLSPKACQAKDKAGWMALFDYYHIVEDPVGSAPHVGGIYQNKDHYRGNGALSRFFDTFIAPNNIQFNVNQDIVHGYDVVRDVTLIITMSANVEIEVPMYLLYELRERDESVKIARLAAHWAFLPMIKQLMQKGLSALPVGLNLTLRMLKYQGLQGTLGFGKAVFSVGSAGQQCIATLTQSIAVQDLPAVMQCFDHDEVSILNINENRSCSCPSALLDQPLFHDIRFERLIAAGDTVSSRFISSQSSGVAFFEFNRKNKKITRIKLFHVN